MADDWQEVTIESGDAWNFEADTVLQGALIAKEENVGPNNSMMYRVQKEDGTEVGVWGNTVLDARFKRIEVGEEVRLTYLGKAKSEKTGRTYHNFKVEHRARPMEEVQ